MRGADLVDCDGCFCAGCYGCRSNGRAYHKARRDRGGRPSRNVIVVMTDVVAVVQSLLSGQSWTGAWFDGSVAVIQIDYHRGLIGLGNECGRFQYHLP